MSDKKNTQSMALFCDFENVALGVRDAKFAAFDIKKVLERLLLKGNIVVKKAYCDWDRYKEFKAPMHEASFELIEIPHVRQSGKNSADIRMVVDALDLCYTKAHVDTFVIISGDSDFSPLVITKVSTCDWDRYKEFKAPMHEASFELIEIPHVRQSGKNSADIRMVVDALDLCYTKAHVDTFVIISGDSDFSPLVSKLRENSKVVIGVGVKNSTSDLLTSNCDEFIYYDDLARESEKQRKVSRKVSPSKAKAKTLPESEEALMQKGIDLVLATVEDLFKERGEEEKVWGSMVKQTLKRRHPGFSEDYHGFRTFGQLLEEAQKRKLLKLESDEKSGGYIIKPSK